jgi:hypothetical protein
MDTSGVFGVSHGAKLELFRSCGITCVAAPCAASFPELAEHGYAKLTAHEDVNIADNEEL